MVAWTQSKEVSKIFDKFWQTCFWNLPTQNLEAWSLDTNMSHVSHNWLWKRFSTPCQTQSMFNNRVGDLSHKICLGTCLIKKWGHQLMTKRVPNLLTRGCLFRTEMGHSSHTHAAQLWKCVQTTWNTRCLTTKYATCLTTCVWEPDSTKLVARTRINKVCNLFGGGFSLNLLAKKLGAFS